MAEPIHQAKTPIDIHQLQWEVWGEPEQTTGLENHLSPLLAKMKAQQAQIRVYLSSPSALSHIDESIDLVEGCSKPFCQEELIENIDRERPQRAVIYRLSRNGGIPLCA